MSRPAWRGPMAAGLGSLLAALGLLGCAQAPTPLPDKVAAMSPEQFAPVVFIAGNGDTAALWQTTLWRFESNGWPRDRLFAPEIAYPLARDDDSKPQPGRSGSAEQLAFVKAEVERVLAKTGASRVVLVSNSRGGYAVRNYIQNAGGSATVSHAILGGAPNHGVWAIKGFREANEFAGTGPFLTALNAPKNPAGDEVTGPVQWLTVRSDNNDKYAQPDGVWIGAKGTPTHIDFTAPELKGATSVVLPRVDHRETSFSMAAFDADYRFLTGSPPPFPKIVAETDPVLDGRITGLGVNNSDPASGNTPNNLPLEGARLTVYAIDPASGQRLGAMVHTRVIGADGRWGPFKAANDAAYEFVIEASGYTTTHIYRSPFPRGSNIIHMHPERLAAADREAGAVVIFTRPRGYFDATRDRMSLDGSESLPGVPPTGAGVSSARLKLPPSESRVVRGKFNDETVTGRSWPAAANHVSVLELTY